MNKNIIDEFVEVGMKVRNIVLKKESEILFKKRISQLQLRINNSDSQLFVQDLINIYNNNSLNIPNRLITALTTCHEVTFKTYANAYIMGLLGGYKDNTKVEKERNV